VKSVCDIDVFEQVAKRLLFKSLEFRWQKKGKKRVCLSALLAQKPKDEVYWGYNVDCLTVHDDVLVHL